MKYGISLFLSLVVFSSCGLFGEKEADADTVDTEGINTTDMTKEEMFASDLCACMGEENKQHLIDMAEILMNDAAGVDSNETYKTNFESVNFALFGCMQELEAKYTDWDGDESQEAVEAAMKKYCTPFSTYIEALEATAAANELPPSEELN